MGRDLEKVQREGVRTGLKVHCDILVLVHALAFDPLAELVQVVHGAVLAQLDLRLVALQGGGGGEGLFQGEHHLVHLARDEWEEKKAQREGER